MSDMLNVDTICAMAAQAAGTEDFGEPIYRPALEALLAAINAEGNISEQHTMLAAMQMSQRLVIRARVTQLLREHPEIRDVPIREPLFILGMPRTGTTLLHNLLSRHPQHWAPKLWELRTPVAPADAGPEWEQEAIEDTNMVLNLLYGSRPEFAAIHPMRADWPDECSWLFRLSYATMIYTFSYRIPSYMQWLTSVDMEPYYGFYRTLLQILQWRRPERRLVLKDPCHLFHLGALLKVFPDAQIVQLHRTMDEALPSLASLIFSLQHAHGAEPKPEELGGYIVELGEKGVFPAMWLRDATRPKRVMDLEYRRLVSDPIGTVRMLCQRIGSSTDDQDIDAMKPWLEENRQHKVGRHAYTLEQFGMDPGAVAQRFGAYQERYLPEEPLRGAA